MSLRTMAIAGLLLVATAGCGSSATPQIVSVPHEVHVTPAPTDTPTPPCTAEDTAYNASLPDLIPINETPQPRIQCTATAPPAGTLTSAQAGTAYLAAARTYAAGMKAADTAYAKRDAPWCGTRWTTGAPDPCDTAAGMAASVHSYRLYLSAEVHVVAAFIQTMEAIKFPSAATGQATALIAAAGAYRDQLAKAARATEFPEIEQLALVAWPESTQRCADALRTNLGLPPISKSGSDYPLDAL